MENEFDNLIHLQALDAEIIEISLFLDNVPSKITKIEKKIESTISIATQAKEKLEQNQKKRRELEGGVQDIKAQIGKYQHQLGGVKSNKEYGALLKEIEIAQLKIDNLEEEQISEMLNADDIAEEIKNANAEVVKAQDILATEKNELLQEKKEKEDKSTALQKEKEELIPSIPKDQIKIYKTIFSKKNGVALSPITDDFCSICQIRIRPQIVNELKEKNKTILCENCGRILYWED